MQYWRIRRWSLEGLLRTCGRAPEVVEAFEREEHVLIAVGEPVRALHARKMLQHGLLHRELYRRTFVSARNVTLSNAVQYLVQICVQQGHGQDELSLRMGRHALRVVVVERER